jgi:hypothetical protein
LSRIVHSALGLDAERGQWVGGLTGFPEPKLVLDI